LRLSSGAVNLLGAGPFDAAVHRGRIAILPQDSELPLESTPLELLVHYGLLQGLDKPAACRSAAAMLQEVHLGDRTGSPVRALSHGMRKRVMIAQCFIGRPEVVLLDEPLSGLDPREVERMRVFLEKRRGRQTLVISSHNLHDIERLCDRVAFVEAGRTVLSAPLSEITGRDRSLVYRLIAPPHDREALTRAGQKLGLTFSGDGCELTCLYDNSLAKADDVNRTVLSALLAQGCGILAVSQGRSLEIEYLKQM
jgi:ABC-type multidrug transport system ATPase subunit